MRQTPTRSCPLRAKKASKPSSTNIRSGFRTWSRCKSWRTHTACSCSAIRRPITLPRRCFRTFSPSVLFSRCFTSRAAWFASSRKRRRASRSASVRNVRLPRRLKPFMKSCLPSSACLSPRSRRRAGTFSSSTALAPCHKYWLAY